MTIYIYDLDGSRKYRSEKPLKTVKRFVNSKLEYIIVAIDYDNRVTFESATLDNNLQRIKIEFKDEINKLFEIHS